MKIAIFGTGAIGAVFGYYLARVGADVTFIARNETYDRVKEKGLLIETSEGIETLFPAHLETRSESVGPVDVVLLCMKAHQVE